MNRIMTEFLIVFFWMQNQESCCSDSAAQVASCLMRIVDDYLLLRTKSLTVFSSPMCSYHYFYTFCVISTRSSIASLLENNFQVEA